MRIPSDLNVKNKKDHLKLNYFECIIGIILLKSQCFYVVNFNSLLTD